MGSAGQGYILSDLAYLFYKNSIGAATYQEIVNMLLEAVWHRWHSRLPYPSVWLWYLGIVLYFGATVPLELRLPILFGSTLSIYPPRLLLLVFGSKEGAVPRGTAPSLIHCYISYLANMPIEVQYGIEIARVIITATP